MKDLETLTKPIPYSSRPDRVSELYNMDCVEGMKMYPDKYFDLAIVDPPYGIGESGQNNKTRGLLAKPKDYGNKNWDTSSPDKEYFSELFRVSKNQIVWGANHFINKIPFASPCWIVWDKDNGETDFADCELAYTSFPTAVRQFSFRWNGMLQQNMKNKEVRIHPTQKPIALYKWLLSNYAKGGDKILDTHLGSGSHRIAAFEMGFDFTSFELDAQYCEASEKRFVNAIAQQSLF
jgi:site-specific DNA-methyltransferase (adenine-specific)